MPQVAELRLLHIRREFDRGYSYLVPDGVFPVRGSVAAVPFGKANRPAFGVITKIDEIEAPLPTEQYKEILYVLEAPYRLSDTIVDLCLYYSEQLLCTVGELAKAALPTGLTFSIREFVTLRQDVPDTAHIPEECTELYTMLISGARVEVHGKNRTACEKLIRAKIARRAYLPENAANKKFEKYVLLACDPENLPQDTFKGLTLTNVEHYKKALQYLTKIPVDAVPKREFSDRFHLSTSVMTTLERRGLIRFEAREVYRGAYEEKEVVLPQLASLNDEQQEAFESVSQLMSKKNGAAVLLHGVTGSGKTRVMLHLIRLARSQSKGVIFLVPEIGLTSRAAHELLTHFPNEVTVLHSGLSAGERHDAWVALKNGERNIVLGTRSAIFAPVQDLGLILVDEEQDQSYNADNSPRYHARDIARYRASHENAVLLLASATPDIESFHKASSGLYTLCRLNERANKAPLPDVEIVDLREDARETPDALIGTRLRDAISKTLSHGEQCLLFMNRRGYQYAPFCPKCGHVITCPNCSVSLTLHSFQGRYACCHYCGYTMAPPSKCPSCGAEHIFFKGYGTQRLEEELCELFPQARVIRMDADTVAQKFSHEKIVQTFANGDADILIGTQMIAKGHDFPNVTLVGVVMADTSLYLGDYRAGEETFALLTQVIGRAGRADKRGHAIIQTLNPQHEIFSLASSQDYDSFYRGEIALRKAVLYPPFCHMSVFTISCPDDRLLYEAARAFNTQIADELAYDTKIKLIVYGPIDPAVLRVRNQYRKKFVIKHQNDRATRALFARLLSWFSETQDSSLSLYYDFSPTQI